MKKIVFFSLLLALSLWALVYVSALKEKKRIDAEKVTVVESQAASSLASFEAVSSQNSSVSSAADFRLRVLTEPEGAEVFLDADKIGQAPIEVVVPQESRKMRLSLEGYEDYERQVPAARDSEGDLVWKIQLRKSNALPASPPKFYTREIAPFSIQIKAIPLSEFSESEASYEGLKPKFCRVRIKDAIWVRVIAGPYSSKKKAQDALAQVQLQYSEAFVGTKHKCLKDGEVK
jgi:hypothetical protein